MEIRPLAELNFGSRSGNVRPMNVCIVSSEFLGPVKNGGIGTATSALAQQLVADGHHVTLLYTYVGYGKPISGDKPWGHWVRELAAQGIVLEHIPHAGDYREWREASWLVKDFIGGGKFELVYFNDHFGSGYYSMLAKHAGLAPFRDQLHCVITHGSMEWVFKLNDYYARRVTDVEWMGLERRSVELADVVIAPSVYLLREYESYGWCLPAQTFHQPYLVYRTPVQVDDSRRRPVSEFVFFGRLEVRKGLWLFCEALDRIAARFPRTDVTFLGRVTEFSGISSALQIVNRAARWPNRVRLLTDFDQEEAVSYLRKPGRLAVMPSIADNSPCVVYECMESGIPFISTRGSGADELVDPACWDDMMVEPSVTALAEKLEQVVERGARLGRPRFDPKANLEIWSAWHRYVAENRNELLGKYSAGPQSVGTAQADRAALMVVIDSGDCELSLLTENLRSHMSRFGARAAYLILTERRGELQDALLDIFSGVDASQIGLGILDPRAIEEARQLIAASDVAFVLDATAEILTSFFVSAHAAIQGHQADIVSCAVAVRKDRGETGLIEELPCGDLPGLAALGEPIGSSIWAVSGVRLASELSALELYDAQLDQLTPALVLGQRLMQECRVRGKPVQLIPTVGATETRSSVRRPQTGLSEARRSARALGLVPTVYGGGPPWFAISAHRTYSLPTEAAPIGCSDFLPATHPIVSLQRAAGAPEREDLPELAAALGRPELSLQLEAARGPVAGRARHLTDLATRALRLRPRLDLVEVLNRGNVTEFGKSPLPETIDSGRKLTPSRRPDRVAPSVSLKESKPAGSTEQQRTVLDTTAIFVDARKLRLRRNRVQSVASLREGGPSKIYIFDVPLCGHSTLVVSVGSVDSDPALLRLKVIDQRMGEEIGSASGRIVAGQYAEFSIRLFEIYVRAAIVFEFSGAEKMDLTIERLQAQ